MLEQLIQPQAIAIFGASGNPAKVGHAFVANLLASGYQGKIVPVNPEATDVLGVPCHRNLRDYDGKIDLGIVVVPPKFVKQAVQDAIDAGAKVVTVVTAGFREVSADGAVVARMTMKEIADNLPAKDFIRVHRSFILPVSRIQSVRNKIIYIAEKEIPIGNTYVEEFFNVFKAKF